MDNMPGNTGEGRGPTAQFDAQPPYAPAAPESAGCAQVGALIFMLIWASVLTALNLGIAWSIEQTIFEGSLQIPDMRWAIQLVFGLAIFIPAGAIWLWGKRFTNRRFYAALSMAGLFALLLVPARLANITDAQGANLLQIGGMLLFLLAEWLLNREAARGSSWQGAWIALLAAVVIGIPWLVWGAFGSVVDILLALIVALLFGLSAARVTRRIFVRDEDTPASGASTLLDGLLAALALAVMAASLGVGGNEVLLTITVPVLGWALAALYAESRRADGRKGEADGRFVEPLPALALLVGLVTFWVLALIDPDELSVVISSGAGELIQWAYLAAGVALVLGFLVSAAFWLLRRFLLNTRPALIMPLAVLALLAAGVLYAIVGQPGLYGERLFVILKDQADLSSAAQIKDYPQRRAEAYRILVEKADTTQAGLRSQLDAWGVAYTPYYLENAIEVQGGPLLRLWLQGRPEVDRVLNNPMLRPLPEPVPQSKGDGMRPSGTPWNLKTIGADRVWSDLGVDGQGIIVGQSDSGADGAHPELANSYRGRGGSDAYNWFDPWNHSASPTDIGGHGTHTLGTIVGQNVGVAPGAQWIGCVNLARNLGNPAFYLDCMQFMLAPFPQDGSPLRDGKPEMGAHVLNNSWGCPPVEGCDPNALLPAVRALRVAGVFVVASAGNEGMGGCASVSDPIALYGDVFSVGAIDQSGQLAPFSSTGPVKVDGSDRIKPDIAAPGVDVPSSFPGGTYASLSGTSMAGPHLVGVVALMWSANPALIGDIDRTQQILDQTAAPYTGTLPSCVAPGSPNNAVGYGIVNAYEAVKMAAGK